MIQEHVAVKASSMFLADGPSHIHLDDRQGSSRARGYRAVNSRHASIELGLCYSQLEHEVQ
jgi:hypothetical protein